MSTPSPATLLAAAAIIDARAAAKGNPHWRRIADELTEWAKDLDDGEDADDFEADMDASA